MADEATLCVSASADERITFCAGALRSLAPGEGACILVPSLTAAERLLLQAVPPGEARFRWQRTSLDALASALVFRELAMEGRVALRGEASVLLAQRALQRVAEAAGLGRFAQIGTTPGFAHVLHRTLSELRLARVSPAQMAAQDATLGALLAAYERELDARGLCDRALLLTRATVHAKQTPAANPSPLLLFDVPLRNACEAEFFAAVAAAAPRTVASVVHGDERTEAYIRRALPTAHVERGRARARSQLDLLKARLFVSDSCAPAATPRENVDFIASPGEAREAVEVVRRVLSRAAEGVPFDRIAIVLRAADQYRDVVEEALGRGGVPAYFAEGVERPQPAGRAFLTLLQCAREGVTLDALGRFLALGAMRPMEGVAASPLKFERVLRAACAGVAPEHYERCLIHFAERCRTGVVADSEADDGRDAAEARETAARTDAALATGLAQLLSNIAPSLRALATPLPFTDALAAMAHLAEQALEEPEAVREVLAELLPLAADVPTDAAMLLALLTERLSHVRLPARGRAAGHVYVCTPAGLRGLSFDSCFVLGLSEQLFPQRPREDALLSDALRVAIAPELSVTSERVHEERVLLHLAVGAAENALTFSFPRFDPLRGRPRVPSFYGLEVLQAIDGVLPAFDALTRRAHPGAAARLGYPAPDDPDQAIDAAEYDLSVLGRLKSGSAAERAGAARYLLAADAHLARALRFRARRWNVERFNTTDGFVASDAAVRAFVAERSLARKAYAPTTLEHLSACPYRFFLAAFVGLPERERASHSTGLSSGLRGMLVHALQSRLLRAASTGVPREDAYAGLASLAEQVESELATVLAELVPAAALREDPVVRSQAADVARDVRQWLQQLADEREYRPLAMELSFGLEKREERDPRSVEEAVTLPGITLQGAVDLVEERNGSPKPRLRVTDTKTSPFREGLGIVSGGRSLQPVLYALAVEQLFPNHQVEGTRLWYCTTRGDFRAHEVPLNTRTRSVAAAFLQHAEELVSKGVLVAAPAPNACSACGYRSVCGPYEEERVATVKGGDLVRLSALHRLRSLP
jgi:CRISPR/Cas system-associated exonuclease Cas4 (RecB family)